MQSEYTVNSAVKEKPHNISSLYRINTFISILQKKRKEKQISNWEQKVFLRYEFVIFRNTLHSCTYFTIEPTSND